MSIDSLSAGRVFRAGDVMSRAWRIFIGNILFFLLVPFVVQVVAVVAVVVFAFTFIFAGWATGTIVLAVAGIILAVIAALSVYSIGTAIVLGGAFQRMRGQPLRLGEAIQRAFARLLSLLGLALLWALALGLCVLFSVFFVWTITFLVSGSGSITLQVAWPIVVGFLVFLVPATILFVIWMVVVPACVVEGSGAIASIVRSTDLTKGYRAKIFGIVLLLGLLFVAVSVVQTIVGVFSEVGATVVGTIGWLAWSAYWNCAVVMTYHDLRVAKEGIDTSQIAEIFD